MSGPPNKWTKVVLPAGTNSDTVLSDLNSGTPTNEVTAAFQMQCSDGNFLFLGWYQNP